MDDFTDNLHLKAEVEAEDAKYPGFAAFVDAIHNAAFTVDVVWLAGRECRTREDLDEALAALNGE